VSEPLAPRFTRPLNSRPTVDFGKPMDESVLSFQVAPMPAAPASQGFMLVGYSGVRGPGPDRSALGVGTASSSVKPVALSLLFHYLSQRLYLLDEQSCGTQPAWTAGAGHDSDTTTSLRCTATTLLVP
jgi:hypothetical protein